MRHPDDTLTAELPGFKSSTVTKRGRKKLYATPAEKQAAYRARKGIKTMTIELPEALHAEFMVWLQFKDKQQSAVVAHLIRSQLLRKR